MKKILIISAYYAPKIHVASNRAMAIAKYLKKSGFDVTVLSEFSGPELVKQSADQGINVVYLDGRHFLNRGSFFKKAGFPAHQLKTLKNKILNFFVADDMPGFYLSFKKLWSSRRLDQWVDLREFDLMLSTFAPLSCHLIGLEIKRNFPKIIWIADFRDEMSFLPTSNLFLRSRLKKMEAQVVAKSDVVSTISKPLLSQFKSTGNYDESKLFVEVRNGFDFSLHQEPEVQKEVFKITYAGTFYGARNPLIFFEALKKFTKKYPSQKILFDIYGSSRTLTVPAELASIVFYHEKIKYENIRDKLIDSSALLLIEPSQGRVGGYTGKLFDYLAINRPILAFIKLNDVADDLIIQCKAGYTNRYYHEDEVFNTLEKVYQDWLVGNLPLRNWEIVKQQSRENQISKLIELLKNLPEAGKL